MVTLYPIGSGPVPAGLPSHGTALDGWLGADQSAALGARYENVGFV